MSYNGIDTNLCNFTDDIMSMWTAKRVEQKYFPDSAMSGKIDKDTLQVSNTNNKNQKTVTADGADDGKISLKEKIKNFGEGLVAPIKTMFASPKNMAITAASVVGGAVLIAATGGAAAPVLVAAGLIGGGIQIGKGIYKQAKATTDNEAKQAWQQMGSGTFTVGASALSAKSALKAAKVEGASKMSTLSAAGKCIKDLPKNIKTSAKNISGKFPKKAVVVDTPDPTSVPTKPEVVDTPDPTSVPTKPEVVDTPEPTTAPTKVEVVDTPDPTVAPTKVEVVDTPDPTTAPTKVEVVDTPDPTVAPTKVEVVDTPDPTTAPTKVEVVETPDPTTAPTKVEVVDTPDPTTAPTKVETPEVTDEANIFGDPSKHSLIERFKNFMKVFGLFLPKKQ